MLVHRPPDPRERAAYLLAPSFLWIVWLAAAAVIRHPAMQNRGEHVVIINFVLGPPLGLLCWQWFGPRRFRKGHERRSSTAEHSDARRKVFTLARDDDGVFCSIVEADGAETHVPEQIRLPCLRRPGGYGLLRHPMMMLQYVCAGIEIWLLRGGGSYEQYLAAPAAGVFTIATLTWLVVGGTAWNVIEIRQSQAWLDDVERSALRGHERERILAAAPTGDGLVVTLERSGEVRLWFPGGSLSEEVQQEIALDALRTHANVPEAAAGEAAGSTEPRGDAP